MNEAKGALTSAMGDGDNGIVFRIRNTTGTESRGVVSQVTDNVGCAIGPSRDVVPKHKWLVRPQK